MATLTELIESDVRSLELYFKTLFEVLPPPEPESLFRAPNVDGDPLPHGYGQFVRPDMVCNVYSLLDFWLTKLCEFAERQKALSLGYKDIRGTSDFNSRHKYLVKVAGLELAGVASSYESLDIVRRIRNCYLHGGGHADEELQKRLRPVAGVNASAGLILVADEFIWGSLKHARDYLAAVVVELLR